MVALIHKEGKKPKTSGHIHTWEETKTNDKQQQSSTVTVIQHHCSGRKTNMINSANMISQQSNSNLISDPNKWSHSSVGRKQRKMTKNNNQQR